MFMKTKYILSGLIASLLLTFAVSSCESYNEGVNDTLNVNREFSPIGLTAKIRNQTTVELNWNVKQEETPGRFVVQFSADDTEFKTIYKTVEVTASQLPLSVQLEGETTYSIRIKAISAEGKEDSKWSVTTATTLTEQIFFPVQDADIEAKQVTLRWTPNSSVTQITVEPSNIVHVVTPAEKIAGVATITGLTGETAYTATLLNGTKKRGVVTFTTGIDIGTGILVKPEDDLNAKITAAPAGSVLVLMPGDYQVFKGEIVLNKSITLRGLRPGDKPKLHVRFTLNTGAANLSLVDLDSEGADTTVGDSNFITLSGASAAYGNILISGCYVHDYLRALMYGNASLAKLTSFTVDNTIVKNVNTNKQADFIDFRNTYAASIVVKNSTFDTCSIERDFVRADAVLPANGGSSGTGLTTNVLIEGCTLYKVSNNAAPKRLLYLRFGSNSSTVRNTLIVSTTGIYTNQPATIQPTFTRNYYFEAPSFIDATITNNKIDASATTANPQFVNAATGNFKVQNQTLIDNNIGDPRWLK
ncbi:DUF5123 domain-containing protein [Flavobacterium reichenbachii]|uniref:Fibronectin n=2 Tax=Flavobacterium reichenbachii TaxID=362418 RepID=A0A085ZKV7_9FLAO|nr:fibronectin [Flavobacterium reichenbachii]OXB16257.1 DUF5123 domain-containing protein [Flavobacterium reichenbachii]